MQNCIARLLLDLTARDMLTRISQTLWSQEPSGLFA
jgi:hypothetical protein